MSYESTANELVRRIEALIPDNPQILTMDSPWDLFSIPGFKCNDINPSLHQAWWALAQAKEKHRRLEHVEVVSK